MGMPIFLFLSRKRLIGLIADDVLDTKKLGRRFLGVIYDTLVDITTLNIEISALNNNGVPLSQI